MGPDAVTRLPGCIGCRGGSDDPIVIQENGFNGRKCSTCGLIYIDQRPDPALVADLYGHDDANVSAQTLIDSYESRGRALKANFTLRLIREHVGSGSLLEIGPGGGAFLRQARKHFEVHAAEFNPAQVEFLQGKGIDCLCGPFSDVFKGRKFDVIYSCDVLSHFFNPVDELRAMRAMLNVGGVVVLETGNNGDLDQRYYRLTDRWQYPDHLFFFSDRSLANLAAASGFEIKTKQVYSRLIEHVLDRKLRAAKSTVKGQRVPQLAPTSASRSVIRRKMIALAMSVKHTMDYLLIYRLGAFLPKQGRPQTVIAVLSE